AQGNTDARIFCREFHAELVAIAGHYKVLEDVPKELRGKPVQVWLEHGPGKPDQLMIAAQ
ncbi:MAG: septum site-determining protein MinC, partial [Pseudoxanthomonas sp.]